MMAPRGGSSRIGERQEVDLDLGLWTTMIPLTITKISVICKDHNCGLFKS